MDHFPPSPRAHTTLSAFTSANTKKVSYRSSHRPSLMARRDAGPHWLNPVVMTTELWWEKWQYFIWLYTCTSVIIFTIFKKQNNYTCIKVIDEMCWLLWKHLRGIHDDEMDIFLLVIWCMFSFLRYSRKKPKRVYVNACDILAFW